MIGIFDSGMGGLTVLRELCAQLPQQTFLYLGDTARLPYGTKSADTIRQYAAQMAALLLEHPIEMLIIACNTATAAALPYLEAQFPHLPILGVVEPGAMAAVQATQNQRILVLATESTVSSGVYERHIHALNPQAHVHSQACGLFVALAEEGFVDNDVAYAAVREYLSPLISQDTYDCILLGCTHFPVLADTISTVVGPHINVINSAYATATMVRDVLATLTRNHQHTTETAPIQFLVTDSPERFQRVGERFLQQPIALSNIQQVDVRPHPSQTQPNTQHFSE